MKTLILVLVLVGTARCFAVELVQGGDSDRPAVSPTSAPLTAREFFIPPDARHYRDPSWPERLTLEDVPNLSVDDLSYLLAASPWERVQTCNGAPVTSAFLRTNGFPNYWTTGRFQFTYDRDQWTRYQTFPKELKRDAIQGLTIPYEVESYGGNLFKIKQVPYQEDFYFVQRVNETGELVLVLPHPNRFCPDGSPVQTLQVPLVPNVS